MAQEIVNPSAQWDQYHLKPNPHCSLENSYYGIPQWENADGLIHRVDENGIQDGPARIYWNGSQVWYFNGQRHRLGGPALIGGGGLKYWYLDGVNMTQEKWAQDPRVIEYHSRTQEGAEEWLKRL